MNTKEVDREGYFKAALELSKDEPARLARVQEARGDYFFERGEYQRAAKQYSQTNKSFEEIAIQYIRHGKQEELLGLVELKLVHIVEAKQGFQDKATQICCLCTWCAQLHLAKMNKLVDDEEAYAEAQEEFHDFLTNHLEDMDKVTICDLIATSARPDEFLFLIELLTDYQRLIAQYMTQNKPDKALDCLIKHCFSEKYEELWYIVCPQQYPPLFHKMRFELSFAKKCAFFFVFRSFSQSVQSLLLSDNVCAQGVLPCGLGHLTHLFFRCHYDTLLDLLL